MTGIIRIGVTEGDSFKNIRKRCTFRFSKTVHIIYNCRNILRIYRAYAESTLSRLIVGTKAGLSQYVHFFSYARAMK